MKRKTITIILAFALCMSLATPAFAAETMVYELSGTPMLEITNVTSVETDTLVLDGDPNDNYLFWYTHSVSFIITTYYTTAPTTVTLKSGTWVEGVGGILRKVTNTDSSGNFTDFEEVPLSIGERDYGGMSGGMSLDDWFTVSEGSAYILDEGIYETFGLAMDSHEPAPVVRIIVSGSGTPSITPAVPTPATPPSADDIKVIVNGTTLTFDQPPVVVDGRTLVPLRAIFEALGAEVDYEQSTQTVTAVRDNITVSLTIGSNILTKNGEQITLDVPAQIIGGRTLVPARAIAESFGAEVIWDAATRVVTITE